MLIHSGLCRSTSLVGQISYAKLNIVMQTYVFGSVGFMNLDFAEYSIELPIMILRETKLPRNFIFYSCNWSSCHTAKV